MFEVLDINILWMLTQNKFIQKVKGMWRNVMWYVDRCIKFKLNKSTLFCFYDINMILM